MKSREHQAFPKAQQQGSEMERTTDLSFRSLWKKIKETFRQKKQNGGVLLAELDRSTRDDPETRILFEEGEEVVGVCDAAIGRIEHEAQVEVASLLGETQEVFERIPPSELKRFFWYNLSSSPEGLMTEDERRRNEGHIDFEYIKERSRDWKEYLIEKVKENDVVLLGEAHTGMTIEKTAVADFLEQAKANGITDLGLEIEERLQAVIDRFLETGKFQEADDSADYEKVAEYQRLRCERYKRGDIESLKAMLGFRDTVKDNFVFSGYLHEHYPLLKRARELGLRVRCLDSNQNYPQSEIEEAAEAGTLKEWEQQKDAERDRRMLENTREVVTGDKRKMLALLGSRHVSRGEMRHKNFGDLLSEDSAIKSFRVNLDRDLDSDVTVQETKRQIGHDRNFDSVLYTALERRGFGQIGFDTDHSILTTGNTQDEDFPFDGYVRI